MRPLLAHESMWGNTEAVAPAVAKGVDHDVAVVHVADAPCRCPTMSISWTSPSAESLAFLQGLRAHSCPGPGPGSSVRDQESSSPCTADRAPQHRSSARPGRDLRPS